MEASDHLVPIADYLTLEEAEAVGERLIAIGLTPIFRAPPRFARHTTLLVPGGQADRARKLLGPDLRPPPPEEHRKFHPCPKCGADSPRWAGITKLLLLIVLVVVLLLLARTAIFPYALLAAPVLFIVAVWRLPEFECRQCRFRWSKERTR